MFTDLSPPAVEPVSLDEAKTFLRIDGVEQDDLLNILIVSARTQIETRFNLVLIRRDVRISLDVDGLFVRVPIAPVASLLEITRDGTLLPATLDTRPRPARISFENRQSGCVDVDLVAGFGGEAQDVPVPIRQAILLLVADAFEHREREVGFERTSLRVDALMAPYKGPRL